MGSVDYQLIQSDSNNQFAIICSTYKLKSHCRQPEETIMSTQKSLYFVEITDVYCGEANYSWVTRHVIRASSERGAISALARRSGLNWRNDGYRYLSRSGATCALVEYFDPESHADYRLDTDDRIAH